MKITFVLPDANMTGGTRAIVELAKALTARGHLITLSSQPRRPPSLRRRWRAYRDAIRQNRRPPRFENGSSHIDGTDLLHTVRPRPEVRDEDLPDADVVVATWWQTAYPVQRLSISKGAKVYFMQDYGAPGMELELLIPTWRLPMRIVTISNWLKDLVIHSVGPRQVDVMPDGVDSAAFSYSPRIKPAEPTIGFLYREFGVKGYDVVRKAFIAARNEVPTLTLIAPGPIQPTELPLPEGMQFTLRPDNETLRSMYAQCTAWIFASRIEGFGLPILEAMACGTPVIGSPAGAAPEILAQGGGLLLEKLDSALLTRTIVEVMQLDENAWQDLSKRARTIAESYTWERSAEIFEQTCLAALEDPSGSGLLISERAPADG